jgi:integrase
MEQTKSGGVRLKAPKTRAGQRTISLPATAVEALRDHRRLQLEHRLVLGMGRPGPEDFVFLRATGEPWRPDDLSSSWYKTVRKLGLPLVRLHALRHTHASALIAAGLDVVAVSRRLGHSNPTTTLSVYAHRFSTKDTAASVVETALFGKS